MNNKNKEVLRICERKLKYLNYADSTISIYCHYIEKFLQSTKKYHQHINSRDFQSYLDAYKFTSVSQQNQVINAVKFLYKYGLNRKYAKVSFQRPRKERKLPQVIDRDFLINQISAIKNLKHKAILTVTYSVGLRVSEVINLKVSDIDSGRMIIHIKNAKGRKDRIVPLSENVLATLRAYFVKYRPHEYLFNGQKRLKYSATSCNQIVKKYLGSKYHFHLLRHSSFTSMLESGTDLRVIQSIAGHNSSRTTEIYTHVSTNILHNAQLPL